MRPLTSTIGNNDAEKRLNESIKNAHKLSLGGSNGQNIGGGVKQKGFQKPDSQQRDIDRFDEDLVNSPPNLIDESPLLEGSGFDDFDELQQDDLQDLKSRHERLVDTILKEEDDLIAAHHRFIENTINSIKEQEKIRHEVNLPGSDVEEYIVSLNQLLTQKQNEIGELKGLISKFHGHIKQEQDLSQKFYSLQEENADIDQDLDDY